MGRKYTRKGGENLQNDETMNAFCTALERTGIIGKACKAVGLQRSTILSWRKKDKAFDKAVRHAQLVGIGVLEDEAHRRAFEGTERKVFYKGEHVGSQTEYSDQLAMFLLRAHEPEKYRERSEVKVKSKSNVVDALTAGRKRVK